ncbi:hypothetical protein N7513_010840 [Penicillium frequentans]|nr:hypothetical protein N7513_010840 [Penicillium glabrum]
MDWLSHISSDWSDVPFDNIAGHSTTPEPRSSMPQLIDSTSSSTYFLGESFPHNLVVQPSYNSLESISFVDRHAYHDPIERNEHHQATMRDGLSLSGLMPTRSTLPCSSCNVSRQSWPTGPPSSLPNTHSRPEKIE